jgi:hypothetical protein
MTNSQIDGARNSGRAASVEMITKLALCHDRRHPAVGVDGSRVDMPAASWLPSAGLRVLAMAEARASFNLPSVGRA